MIISCAMINVFETKFEARERRQQIEHLFHGETVDLVASITTDGVPNELNGYSVSGFYQSTTDTTTWHTLDGQIANGKVVLHWTPDKDIGCNVYNVWVCLTKNSERSYPGFWRLNMAYSPSVETTED